MTHTNNPTEQQAELRERVLDIIQHIDKPYALTGLGVDKEGYGKVSATDAIMQLITSHNKKLEQRVGFLRQWLNEDRITDPKKMVTNEDIMQWLELSNLEGEKA